MRAFPNPEDAPVTFGIAICKYLDDLGTRYVLSQTLWGCMGRRAADIRRRASNARSVSLHMFGDNVSPKRLVGCVTTL